MICPTCNHEEAYHGQSGCVVCECGMTAGQVETAAPRCCCLEYEGDNLDCKVHYPEAVN